MLYIKSPDILAREVCNQCKILVFLTFKVVFFVIPLSIFKKSISSSINLVLSIIDPEMVVRRFLSSMDLPKAHVFCMHNATQVIIVCRTKDLIFTTFSIMTSGFQNFNNYQIFTVINLILDL